MILELSSVPKIKEKKLKICLACSAGGHLTQLLQLSDLWKNYEHFYLTFKSKSSLNLTEKTYYIKNPKRNPILFLLASVQSLSIFLIEKPQVVITTGAGVAIPISLISKVFRKKLIFIESFSRVKTPSATGKFLYFFADLFLVQWKPLLKKYGSKAQYEGAVF
jgi:UDP-N-acetylglucosamine:LPS N-acetylglucosamine transferase